MGWHGGAFALVAIVLAEGCASDSCPLSDCMNVTFIDVAVVDDPAVLIGAVMRVCVDAACSEGPLPEVPPDCPKCYYAVLQRE